MVVVYCRETDTKLCQDSCLVCWLINCNANKKRTNNMSAILAITTHHMKRPSFVTWLGSLTLKLTTRRPRVSHHIDVELAGN